MILDHDLVRKILLEIEARPSSADPAPLMVEGYDYNDVQRHLSLLRNEGYIDGTSMGSAGFFPYDLTWEGHKFVKNLHDEKIWNKTKKYVISQAGSASIDILFKVAHCLISKQLMID